MLRAMEQIRRMRGGAQSQLMRCSDGKEDDLYYVVKFQNNPQHSRILVNELLGNRIARRMGLPVPPVGIVKVDAELIHWTPALCIEMPRSSTPCCPGLQFGSSHPGDPRRMTLHDFLPDELLRDVTNVHEFAGMLVFDKWTCNTNGRQTLFFHKSDNGGLARSPSPGASPSPGSFGGRESYSTVMIDQGFCFNAGEWNYPDAPLRGLYARNRVYESVIGMESFALWITRAKRLGARDFDEMINEVPPEWYYDDRDSLLRLVEQLQRRVDRIEDLILEAKRSNRQPFPNWR
jgi:hypothetical protein